METIHNYVGGDLVDAVGGGRLDNVDPATGAVFGTLPDSGPEDIEMAVQAAERALPGWANAAADVRAAALERLANWLEQRLDEFARAESIDSGKTFRQARELEIPRAVTNLRFFASLARGFSSESHALPQAINYTLRQPLGVVGCISPWNLPLYLFTWKIAPALAAGNCVIGKPSEVTPLTAGLLCRGAVECGFPPGVLNVVQGLGGRAGAALVDHPRVRALSFTGGTVTGTAIAERTARSLKKVSLELGGKNPNLIFADCDYEKALATTLRSSFANQGQICLCGSRIYVEAPLYERFCRDLVDRARQLRVGDPLTPESDLGAVVSAAHQQKILGCLETARREGGEILCGGAAWHPSGRCAQGFFVQPTVIRGLPVECQTNQQEIFGPVVTVQSFRDSDEAVQLANATAYGLSASIWTGSVTTAHRVARDLAAGVVWVNCWLIRDLRTPFGGVKQSGLGREGGWEAMRFFTETKNVCIEFGGPA